MIIGIVDNHGQPHCLEHAASVSSWSHEVFDYSSTDYVCWCGEHLHGCAWTEWACKASQEKHGTTCKKHGVKRIALSPSGRRPSG